jgi:uncharacterized protein (DUF1330 family)
MFRQPFIRAQFDVAKPVETDTVVLRFPDAESVAGWHCSAAYQALIPLRREAAEVLLVSYEGTD